MCVCVYVCMFEGVGGLSVCVCPLFFSVETGQPNPQQCPGCAQHKSVTNHTAQRWFCLYSVGVCV